MKETRASRIFLRIIVALYALSMIAGGSAARCDRQNMQAGLNAAVASERCVIVLPDDTPSKQRHDFAACPDCALAAAQWIGDPPRAQLIYVLEVAARFDFILRLGRDLDDRPANLRSRAPPLDI